MVDAATHEYLLHFFEPVKKKLERIEEDLKNIKYDLEKVLQNE